MNHTKAILYSIGVWAFPFIVAMFAFPLREPERALFESIMPVSLVLAATFASVKYFKHIKERFAWRGLCLGLIFFAVSFLLDQLFFLWGPMKMSFADYLKDIGVAYLILIIIPTGIGFALSRK